MSATEDVVTVGAPAGTDDTHISRALLMVAAVVVLGAIMSILDTTVVNVAIDHLAVAFHSSLTEIQWVITGYTLALATVIPASAARATTTRFIDRPPCPRRSSGS